MTGLSATPARKKPIFVIGVLAILIALICAVALGLTAQKEDQPKPEFYERLVRYSFTLENQNNEVLEDVVFKAFAPVKTTPFQRVERLETSIPHQVESDGLGNQTLVFNLDSIPPYGQRVVAISVWLKTADAPAFDTYLSSSSFLAPMVDPANHSLLEALRTIEASDDESQWARSANKWVYKTFEDVGYVGEDRGARYALQEKKGDCTEFAHALIALARSKDIPAISVAGFPVEGGNSVLQAHDYHNWVLVNTQDHWRVADPHVGKFEADQERYIAFRLLESESGNQANSQRFFSYDPRIRVRMN